MSNQERHNKMRLTCPHCGAFARVRSSVQMTSLARRGLIDCTNTECNWRGQYWIEYTYTVTPSDHPNPDVLLQPAPFVRERLQNQKESYADVNPLNRDAL